MIRVRIALSLSVVVLAGLASTRTASAVCLYPGTFQSGYKVPLEQEVRSAPIIVVGNVVKARGLAAPKDDPGYYAYWVYTVRVSEVVKGKVPPVITLYASNDSGGYRMNVGETDLLFLRKVGNFYEADSCGNSADLAKNPEIVGHVKSKVTPDDHAP